MQARNEEENADGQPNLTLFALCMFYTFSPPYLVHTLTVDACALLNAYLLLYINNHDKKESGFTVRFAIYVFLHEHV